MATRTVHSFIDMGKAIEELAQENVINFVDEIWKNIVLNPIHPYDTGTLQISWKVSPYVAGTADMSHHPMIGTHPWTYPRRTDYPRLDSYKHTWTSMVLFNNQPYTMKVNNDSSRAYEAWIDKGLDSAIRKFN